MKKRKVLIGLFLLLVIGVVSLIFIKSVETNFLFKKKASPTPSKDMYNYTKEGAENYLIDIYGEGKVKNITQKSVKINAKVANFPQDELNTNYNSRKKYSNDDKVGKTCTIVACLGLVTYFSEIDGFEISVSCFDNYEKILDACLDKGYTTKNNGTYSSKVNNCVTESFSVNNSSRKGNTNWWELHNNIRDAVNGNTPIILDIKDHSTVLVGLTTYEYDCEKEVEVGWWFWEKHKEVQTVHESKEFVIVNDGYSSSFRSIIPLERIKDIYNENQVCWAEK